MDLPDLTTYSDDDFTALQQAVEADRLRRIRLASTPDQIASLASAYIAAGGKLADLTAKLDALGSTDTSTDTDTTDTDTSATTTTASKAS